MWGRFATCLTFPATCPHHPTASGDAVRVMRFGLTGARECATRGGMRWVSLLGIGVLMGIAWALSENRRRFPWRVVPFGVKLLRFTDAGALASYQTATIAGVLIGA